MNIEFIIDKMHQEGLNSLLIIKPENITYLSGYKPSSISVIIIADEATLYVSSMEMEDALNKSKIPPKEYQSINQVKKELKGKVGIEKSMPVSVYEKIRPDLELEVTEIVESFRMIKNQREVKDIQKSIKIAESSLLEIEFNGAENKLAADLEYHMKFNGSIKPAFETIVASGKRSSIPHATISSNKLETPVVIDWGAVYNNYCSDITRTLIGSEKELEIFNIVQEAQNKAIKAIKPGIKASYVDKVARDVIEEYGYGENFIHSTGHGLGLEVHENPAISKNSEFKLEKGMVITVEPGIYIKNQFGIRIEDDILVKNRARVLTNIKKSL